MRIEKAGFADVDALTTLRLEYLIEDNGSLAHSDAEMIRNNLPGYIREHLFTLKDVGELARALFVSEGYLFRLFKQELKNTPKRYITEQRLLAAERLLSQGITPTAAAARCGFQDYATFNRRYTEFFRRRPSEERREALK